MMIGKYLAKNITIPQVKFQNNVLSANPSNPEPLLAADEETLYDCSIYFWLHDFNNNIQNRLNHLPVTNLEKHSLSYATTFTKTIPLTLISVNDINTLKELKERLKDNGHYGIVILSLIDNGKNGETDNKDKKGILRSIIVKNNGKINWLKFRQISDEK